MPKRNLRQQMLARRRCLDVAEYQAASLRVQRAFLSTSEFGRAAVLALYAPVHNEVDTSLVLSTALDNGKKALYPVVTGSSLEFRLVTGNEDFQAGAFSIREPAVSCPVMAIGKADIIVVPGVAYDLTGHRIGYGKGFYDKALHQLEGEGHLVGFCFDFQVVEALKDEPHDVRMDLIITDRRVIRPRD
ncbi:5-formyltetrahydrofolate cyclo-ligase [Geobacter sp. AOG1]|uniref:5-formyltetrahydrofolate cyclo-ligase n=1 Tax=Geobacter sp. AOG1 TaxID=1566346 RepID=UPI001CC35BC3|nr:5-formyltetrahydrofolate cyclo-ligase [Geobacter sp. AOG1]GFE57851.1 5-formyltetrahydrofolate cyclo-ligase [Geobacter sp. AOG1]